MKQPSTALIVALTVIAVCSISATALILITVGESQLPEGWLALFIGLVGSLVTALVTLARTEKIGRQVDDLSNGRMDAKIRAGIADVLPDHLVDDNAREQLADDRQRRNGRN